MRAPSAGRRHIRRPKLLLLTLCAAVLLFHGYRTLHRRQPVEKARRDACPLQYDPIPVSEIAAAVWDPAGPVRPYLFGGPRRPSCSNCNRTGLWSEFCQFKGRGELCSREVQATILADWVERKYELPLTLTPCDLWRHLSGRTLWVTGDSMSLDLYKALKCVFFEFWPSLEEVPLTSNQSLFEALTPSKVGPYCVQLLGNTRLCSVRADTGQILTDTSLPLLLDNGLLSPSDVMVANFGLHHQDSSEQGSYREALDAFLAFYKANSARLPRLLWQQTLAQHFDNPGGSYPGGVPPFECRAIEGFKLQGTGTLVLAAGEADETDILNGQWRNRIADRVMWAAGVPVVRSFNESVAMWGAHRDNGHGFECTHYCHPSAPQASVAALYRALEERPGG